VLRSPYPFRLKRHHDQQKQLSMAIWARRVFPFRMFSQPPSRLRRLQVTRQLSGLVGRRTSTWMKRSWLLMQLHAVETRDIPAFGKTTHNSRGSASHRTCECLGGPHQTDPQSLMLLYNGACSSFFSFLLITPSFVIH